MKKNKLPISCIILAHAIDEKLDSAVSSAKYFGEVLLVATTDEKKEWKAFSRKHNCSLQFFLEPISSFSEIRNWAANKAENDWVFFLDSDEVLEGDSEVKFREFFDIYAKSFSTLSIIRQDIFLGKKLQHGEAKVRINRCYYKKFHTYLGNVHETIASDNVFDSSITLDHFAHDSVSKFLTDITRYAEMASYNETGNRLVSLFKMLTFPIGKWFHALIIKRGILDGYAGLAYATLMSIHSLAVRIFAYEKSLT